MFMLNLSNYFIFSPILCQIYSNFKLHQGKKIPFESLKIYPVSTNNNFFYNFKNIWSNQTQSVKTKGSFNYPLILLLLPALLACVLIEEEGLEICVCQKIESLLLLSLFRNSNLYYYHCYCFEHKNILLLSFQNGKIRHIQTERPSKDCEDSCCPWWSNSFSFVQGNFSNFTTSLAWESA